MRLVIGVAIILSVIVVFTVAALLKRKRTPSRLAKRRARSARASADLNSNGASPQAVCELLATGLEANAIVVERLRSQPTVVAGAPWLPTLQPLDKIALDWCFTTGLPPRSGTGNPLGSDWLFVPVAIEDKVVLVLGLMGRHSSRRFSPHEEPSIQTAADALRRIYQSKSLQQDRSRPKPHHNAIDVELMNGGSRSSPQERI